jgi:hypothetical protein
MVKVSDRANSPFDQSNISTATNAAHPNSIHRMREIEKYQSSGTIPVEIWLQMNHYLVDKSR